MKAYSQDVRERVLRAVNHGYPKAEIVQMFGISLSTLKRYIKQQREEGNVRPKEYAFISSLLKRMRRNARDRDCAVSPLPFEQARRAAKISPSAPSANFSHLHGRVISPIRRATLMPTSNGPMPITFV